MKKTSQKENTAFLKEQIITYLGNKRSLIDAINKEVIKIKKELDSEKTVNMDLFSGSGIVARVLKQHSSILYANDLELYSKIINECYLSNRSDYDNDTVNKYFVEAEKYFSSQLVTDGIISKNYAPKNDQLIEKGERTFYTTRNANYIDSVRKYIDTVPKKFQKYLLAPLIVEASIKTNTAGVFKGFYKDSKTGIGKYGGNGEYALTRIKADIQLVKPILSNFECDVEVFQEDANELVKKIKGIDITYIDPPYNQHPYGSNYFMLNIIANNFIDGNISKVSGIPNNWNRSEYNKKESALKSFDELISNLDSKYIIVSYNSEGFIDYDSMNEMLSKYGDVQIKDIPYITYRGSRNLSERNLYISEYLFILRKESK